MFFDIVGNVPEDILGEIISYFTDVDGLRYLILWQIVSRTWHTILHNRSTKIYHSLFLSSNIGFNELLPPTHYNNSDSFTYSSFRRAIKTHMAIKKGAIQKVREEYTCGKYDFARISAGPVLADGFLVWLEVLREHTRDSGLDREVALKVVDLTDGALKNEGKREVREFGGLGKGLKGVYLELIGIGNTAALGCGGGVVAYWAIWDSEISVRGLHKSSTLDWKIPLSSLKRSTGKVAIVTELICSKDYVVVRLFKSVTYQVFSIAKRAIIHLLHAGLAPVGSQQLDQAPLYDENHFSSVNGEAKCAKKIQDGYFIHSQVTAVGVDMEHQNKFQFLSWNLTVSQSYKDPQYAAVRGYVFDGEDFEGGLLAAESGAEPHAENQLRFSGFGGTTGTKSPRFRSQTCFFLTPSFCSKAIISTPSGNRYTRQYFYGSAGAQMLFEPNNKLHLYCNSPNQFTHTLRRWSYGSPPTSLRLDKISFCEDYLRTPSTPPYRSYQKAADWVLFTAQNRRYELITTLKEPISSHYYFGAKRDRIRLQMTPLSYEPHYKVNHRRTSASSLNGRKQSKQWDIDIKVFISQQNSPGCSHGAGMWVGWEGVVVHWRDRILVWGWDLSYDEEAMELGQYEKGTVDSGEERRGSEGKGKGKGFLGKIRG